jgi:hypothetical protein
MPREPICELALKGFHVFQGQFGAAVVLVVIRHIEGSFNCAGYRPARLSVGRAKPGRELLDAALRKHLRVPPEPIGQFQFEFYRRQRPAALILIGLPIPSSE